MMEEIEGQQSTLQESALQESALQESASQQSTSQQSTSQQSLSIQKKRKTLPNYTLDENIHKEYDYGLNLREQKKIRLDTTQGREEALNERQSFVNLVSSASLLLPPEMEAVVITRNNFMVEWDQLDRSIPTTKVTQLVQEEKMDEFQEEIHRNSFKLPFFYCNDSTSKDRRDRAVEEKRNIITTYVANSEHSFSINQMEKIGTVNKQTIKEAVAAKREREKLARYTRMINHVLENFQIIDPRNVPVRDRKMVSIYYQTC
jgi:hypothetical protein